MIKSFDDESVSLHLLSISPMLKPVVLLVETLQDLNIMEIGCCSNFTGVWTSCFQRAGFSIDFIQIRKSHPFCNVLFSPDAKLQFPKWMGVIRVFSELSPLEDLLFWRQSFER